MSCPLNKIKNPVTGRCVLKTGAIGKKLLRVCPENKILNPDTKRCVLRTGKVGLGILEGSKTFEGIRKSCKDVGWVKKRNIGKGAFGIVYIACRANNCDYVLKIQKIDKDFYNEVNLLKELSEYYFVPTIYDAWTCRGNGYIVMEKLNRKSNLTKAEKHVKIREIIKTLHKNNIVYFDLHPDNVMYKGNKLYLIDFGLSKKFKNKSTKINHMYSDVYGKFKFAKGVRFDYLSIDKYFGNRTQKRKAEDALDDMLVI